MLKKVGLWTIGIMAAVIVAGPFMMMDDVQARGGSSSSSSSRSSGSWGSSSGSSRSWGSSSGGSSGRSSGSWWGGSSSGGSSQNYSAPRQQPQPAANQGAADNASRRGWGSSSGVNNVNNQQQRQRQEVGQSAVNRNVGGVGAAAVGGAGAVGFAAGNSNTANGNSTATSTTTGRSPNTLTNTRAGAATGNTVRSKVDAAQNSRAKISGYKPLSRAQQTQASQLRSKYASKYPTRFSSEPRIRPDYIPQTASVGGRNYTIVYNNGGYGYYGSSGWMSYDPFMNALLVAALVDDLSYRQPAAPYAPYGYQQPVTAPVVVRHESNSNTILILVVTILLIGMFIMGILLVTRR